MSFFNWIINPFVRGTARFVVTAARARPGEIAGKLQGFRGVKILDKAGDDTLLVEMPDKVRRRVEHDLPELTVEPNIYYKHVK
jgi:hypothetical protein